MCRYALGARPDRQHVTATHSTRRAAHRDTVRQSPVCNCNRDRSRIASKKEAKARSERQAAAPRADNYNAATHTHIYTLHVRTRAPSPEALLLSRPPHRQLMIEIVHLWLARPVSLAEADRPLLRRILRLHGRDAAGRPAAGAAGGRQRTFGDRARALARSHQFDGGERIPSPAKSKRVAARLLRTTAHPLASPHSSTRTAAADSPRSASGLW